MGCAGLTLPLGALLPAILSNGCQSSPPIPDIFVHAPILPAASPSASLRPECTGRGGARHPFGGTMGRQCSLGVLYGLAGLAVSGASVRVMVGATNLLWFRSRSAPIIRLALS